jgi:hypothetical protein
LAKLKKPNFIKVTTVMKKEGEMIPKIFPKLGKDSKVRKNPPKSCSNNLVGFPSKRSTPPLLELWQIKNNQRLGGTHTLVHPPWTMEMMFKN